MPDKNTDSLLISERILRRLIGILGIVLPFALIVANHFHLQPSISEFYYADDGLPAARNLFVGVMCAVGVFLCCYKGWDIRDRGLASTAGFSAILVAVTPVALEGAVGGDRIRSGFHLFFAAVFLLSLAAISYFQFTKTKSIRTMTPQKRTRNHVYRICGLVMAGCLLGIAIYKLFIQTPEWQQLGPVFWLESLAVIVFGISWLVKGEVIFGDPVKKRR